MNHVYSRAALAFSVTLMSFSAMANPTTIGCKSNAEPAKLHVSVEAWTSLDDQHQPTCPLLEEKASRKLVEKFGAGTTFAYPLIPGFCLSGTVTEGTLTLDDETVIIIDPTASYTESAQRLFPVPTGQEILPPPDVLGLFATSDDGTLQVGAAMTAAHLRGEGLKLDLLLDDRFLITGTGEDMEDFLIVGSKGDYKASGRLTGIGQVFSQFPLGISFEVSGTVCLK